MQAQTTTPPLSSARSAAGTSSPTGAKTIAASSRSGGVWSVDEGLRYAQHYFARYPALSLGHHPILLPVTLVPFYAIFGVSVTTCAASAGGCAQRWRWC